MDRTTRRLGGYLALGGLLVVLDTTVTSVAVPRLVADFGTGLAATQWVTTAYTLALVAVIPTAAWLSGRIGARTTYLLALALFTAGSLLSGLATGIGTLVAFRVVQGLGGGLLNPVGNAIALAAVPPRRRGRMMSLLGVPVLVGPLAGPVLGGTLVDHASWRWIFWIDVPLGVAAVVAGRRVLPRGPRRSAVPLDVAGLLLLSPGLTLFALSLSIAGERGGVGSVAVLAPFAVGVSMVAVFVRRAWRADHPLVRLTVLRLPAMSAGAGTLGLFAAAYFGAFVVLPAYVQIVRGDSATLAGLVGVPQALATGLMLQVATRLVDRVQPRLVVGAGIATALAGTLARVAVIDAHTSYGLLMALGAVTGLGVGATLMPTMTAASRPLSGPDLPSGTALLAIVSQAAVATGTALVAAVLSWLAGVYAPGSHGGGLAAATHLDPAERAALAPGLARATQLTFAVTAVLMALAWLTSRRLPLERAEGSGAGSAEEAGGAREPAATSCGSG